MATTAERMFDGFFAESALEVALDDAGAQYERLGWDHYDNSLELHGCLPDYRLSIEVQKIVHNAGFSTCYVNHTDKWETHYNFKDKDFKESKGWRVSYPHRRGENDRGILLEERCQSWPTEWFETGYCQIVKPEGQP